MELIAGQPKQKQESFTRRKRILESLGKTRGTRVLALVHEVSAAGEVSIEDTEHILLRLRQLPPKRPVDLLLHTPGGLLLAAEMIAMALKNQRRKVTSLIPFYALSGGTLIALASEKILMDPNAMLGPIDPQIGEWPAGDLISLVKNHRRLDVNISEQTYLLYRIAQKALDRVRKFASWLLEGKMPAKRITDVVDFLAGGYTTHDTPITFRVAESLGLPVSPEIPPAVYEYFDTCSFGECQRPCILDYGKVTYP